VTIEDGAKAFAGERIIFRKNAARFGGICNGDFATILAVDAEKDLLKVKLDNDGRTVTVSLRDFDRERVSLAYSVTSHLSQGGSFKSVYLYVHGNMTDAQAAYVMASRHTDSVRLYTTTDDAGEGLTKLVRDMSRDRTKILAIETGTPALEKQRRQEQDLDFNRFRGLSL
jgi:hypothetical protein